ncbi:Hsp20 family protein [Sansalvadorimonas sp. 2012CJ34-2]|uniref:Hsp20 family protein n=1 Tax=Parendozoicomonas callyspongiae TaxID=2942213 RepID=A0ABT0PDV3_9GAMM|nr:Hsp20 family protein [Sansalvadorimonas sp. 2012CJ34-2]MCL6269451.1 Hsp20 family protein [Sansalvadorimonas sp. 2012CJ34-2]
MRTFDFDFSPLYRSAIGFDRMASMLENINQSSNQNGYPPYNIELLGENNYRITMAIAGFTEDELEIESRENVLTIKGKKPEVKTEREYLYQGIAERNFERRFQLADHVKVNGANMENGLLHIELEREIPEAKKPRKIAINGSKLLENESA